MSGTLSPLANLLADCEAHGIRLMPASDNELTIDAPPEALTPELLDRLKVHKAGLLTLLRPAASNLTDEPVGPCAWCGRSTWWRSVYGVVICGNCHPPAVPGLVAEWIERDETVQVEKPNVQEPGCCVSTG